MFQVFVPIGEDSRAIANNRTARKGRTVNECTSYEIILCRSGWHIMIE